MKRYALTLVVGIGLLLTTLLAQLCIGPFGIGPGALFKALLDLNSPDRFSVVTLGLPRYFVGMLAGIALGSSGAIVQTVTRNSLASPDMLGFGTGSATGAIISLLLNQNSTLHTAVMAALGGLTTAAVVYGRRRPGRGPAGKAVRNPLFLHRFGHAGRLV